MPYEWTEMRRAYWKKTLEFHGVTPNELNAVRKGAIVAQAFKCGVCGRDLSGRTCYLDHDHYTGAIRGILCFNCNRFLVARNSRETAAGVVAYLNDPPAAHYIDGVIQQVKAGSSHV